MISASVLRRDIVSQFPFSDSLGDGRVNFGWGEPEDVDRLMDMSGRLGSNFPVMFTRL